MMRPIDRQAVQPDAEDVATVRATLAPEVLALEERLGLQLREAWGWEDVSVTKSG